MQGTVGKNTNSRDGDTPDHPAMGGVFVDVETVELLVDRACVERYWADYKVAKLGGIRVRVTLG